LLQESPAGLYFASAMINSLSVIRAVFWVGVLAGPAEQGEVVVEARRDPGRWFVWTVTNHSTEPITYFRAPHWAGYTVNPPDGWTFNVPHKDSSGFVICEAPSRALGIRIGEKGEFRLEVKDDHLLTPQTVVIGFADGRKIEVPGVTCPSRPSFLQVYVPAIGLGGAFGLYVLVTVLRGRRKNQSTSAGQ
jgi:hypothetical protein